MSYASQIWGVVHVHAPFSLSLFGWVGEVDHGTAPCSNGEENNNPKIEVSTLVLKRAPPIPDRGCLRNAVGLGTCASGLTDSLPATVGVLSASNAILACICHQPTGPHGCAYQSQDVE